LRKRERKDRRGKKEGSKSCGNEAKANSKKRSSVQKEIDIGKT